MVWFVYHICHRVFHDKRNRFNPLEKSFNVYCNGYFVDIAFILTPNISEIWGAKFSDIGKTVQSIKRSLIASKARGEIYTTIIQNVNPAVFGTMEWHTEEEYTKSLNAF